MKVYRYWCHFSVKIDDVDPPEKFEGATGIELPKPISTFEDCRIVSQVLANKVAKDEKRDKVGVLLYSFTLLAEDSVIQPPPLARAFDKKV